MSAAPGKVRPSGFWYLLPFVLVVAGGVAAIISIVNGVSAYSDTIEEFARVDVGEQGTIEIDGTGGYTVFYEPGVSDESSLDENDPEPPLEMTDPSGQPVTFEDYESFGTYGSSGYVGFAIRTFDVSEPGNYELKVGGQPLGGTVAVGRSPFEKITNGVLLGLVFGFGGFLLALVILIVLMVARGRSKRRIRAANPYIPQYAAPAWSGGPTGYPQQPQYPPSTRRAGTHRLRLRAATRRPRLPAVASVRLRLRLPPAATAPGPAGRRHHAGVGPAATVMAVPAPPGPLPPARVPARPGAAVGLVVRGDDRHRRRRDRRGRGAVRERRAVGPHGRVGDHQRRAGGAGPRHVRVGGVVHPLLRRARRR